MNDDQKLAWMARRLTFGGGIADLPSWADRGPDRVLDELTDPDASGVAEEDGPWSTVDVPDELSVDAVVPLVDTWLDHLASTTRPLEAWLTWFWHDYFAVAANQVRALSAFTAHIELLRTHALGTFPDLLRAVTIDPGMLVFLDGVRNARGQINENYGRELLELYSLGVGNFDEGDVRAAAVALTGWVWRPGLDTAVFLPRRHDPTPQVLLGQRVSDLDGVLDAVTGHPACPQYVVQRLAEAVLGSPLEEGALTDLAATFARDGMELGPLVRRLIERGLAGSSSPIVLSPLQWLLQAERLTGASLEPRQRLFLLRQMGQIPGLPPNVGGYPDADTWAGPSATVGRFRAASVVAALTPDGAPVLDAAMESAWGEVARLAARPDGFSPETRRALDDADPTRRGGREALAAALMTPEMVVA